MTQPHQRKKEKTLFSFYRKTDSSKRDAPSPSNPIEESPPSTNPPSPKRTRFEDDSIPIEMNLERDPGLRIPIWQHPINKQDEIRRAYVEMGPYKPKLQTYPMTKFNSQNRSFQYTWFDRFPWLEYSVAKDAAFCLPCFIFDENNRSHHTFTIDGFRNWKGVNNGRKCCFVKHEGGPNSPHNKSVVSYDGIKDVPRHIDMVMNKASEEDIQKNRLRLGTTIQSISWLTLQGSALRGHDESFHSKNQGNFLEMVKFMAKLRPDIGAVVLENAPGNAKFTSPLIQKDVLHILAKQVRKKIHKEIGDAKFCCLVDESRDSSNKEQMAIVLRFVDACGFVKERFLDIIHVRNTTAINLKKEICDALDRSKLNVHDLRGQGYDGASNMRGAWNGLQALFLREYPSAYYVHCFAHRLQLALVAAAENNTKIYLFFSTLTKIVNLMKASSKRHDELQVNQANVIADSIAAGERETGRGANQMGTLHRAGATRWSSHFDTLCSLIDMYTAVLMTLKEIIDDNSPGSSRVARGEADGCWMAMRTFDFIFILHTMHRIMSVTEHLSKALQQKNIDILSAMDAVSSTKKLLSELRDGCFETLMEYVTNTCLEHDIPILDMSSHHATGRSCRQKGNITVEHYYHFEIFNDAIDFQLREVNDRFSDDAVELLKLSVSLDPKDNFKSFNIENICTLARVYYPIDFSDQDIHILRSQLDHYKCDVIQHSMFRGVETLSDLCQKLVKTNKSQSYFLIERLIRLILTLPVSTASTKRAFSAMKYVKSVLRSRMDEEFLADSLTLYIERDLSQDLDVDSVINKFNSKKSRRVRLQ